MEKKINLGDVTIQIRILRALADIKPFGTFRHFYMIKVLRNLKQPNLITAPAIWEFLETECGVQKFHEAAEKEIENENMLFDDVFDE